MRKPFEPQISFGQVDISKIRFDSRSRDEIPKLLMGLQYVYCTPEIRREVFELLEKELIPSHTDTSTGRPGMTLWKILVLGTIRLNCDWDFDKVKEMADNHVRLRMMLGHGKFDEDQYPLQTIKDNVSLLSLKLLEKTNEIVVKTGHTLIKKNEEGLRGRCDSYVVETNVHYPTDINLLFDALRKVVVLIARLCVEVGTGGWRQRGYVIRKVKKLYRRAQRLKRSNSKDEGKKAVRDERIKEAHREYVDVVEEYVESAKETVIWIVREGLVRGIDVTDIENYIAHAERQIDQIRRRVLGGEKIGHEEKVFSIFEPHTEWISKGKAGVPQELGLKVCILEDQYGFILHHMVMQKRGDEEVAVPMVEAVKEKYAELNSCSFDKGFSTPQNKERLEKILKWVVLPKKGRLSVEEKEIEGSEYFVEQRRKHSAVESGINALENHGVDRCPDHGIEGFERYVALGVLARNLQKMGHIIQQRRLNAERRRGASKYRKAS